MKALRVALCRRRLRMAEQPANDREAERRPRAHAGE